MRSQHRNILNLKRTSPVPQEEIYLSVVIEQGHSLLSDLLAREVVHVHFYVRGKAREERRSGGTATFGGITTAPHTR